MVVDTLTQEGILNRLLLYLNVLKNPISLTAYSTTLKKSVFFKSVIIFCGKVNKNRPCFRNA